MNRFWLHVATGLVTIGAVSALVSACAHDNSSFFLQGVLAPPVGASSSGCVFTDDPTQPILSIGYLDVAAIGSFSNTYEAVFLAGNQIIPQGNQALLQTETSRINIQGAVVHITDYSGAPLGQPFTTLGAGFVNEANGTTPGYGAVQFTIVDPATIALFQPGGAKALGWLERETIVTYVMAFGETLGNDHVESNTFTYPIIVCNGCLIGFQTDPTQAPSPNCAAVAASGASGPTVCFFGQDETFDCHDCSDISAVCRCGKPGLTDPQCLSSIVGPPGDGGTGG